MSTKKKDLSDVFIENEKQLKPQETTTEIETISEPTDNKIRPSRKDKRHIGGYFSLNVYKQLKILGVEKDMTMQDMMAEAFNAFFKLNDKPPIA